MEKQKEALNRIMGTVQAKYEEAERFGFDLHSQTEMLENRYKDAIIELNDQYRILADSLENARNRMVAEIEAELLTKIQPLREQAQNFEAAKRDAEDMITMSNDALAITNQNEFSQVALRIKDRVTMSPIFRISLCPLEIDQTCFFVADFAREQRVLVNLKFLPIPAQPEIISAGCFAENNIVHCLWSVADEDDHLLTDIPASICSERTDNCLPTSIQYFVLQYRLIDDESENTPWSTVECIQSLHFDIKGLIFHKSSFEFRVQAWNKAMGGNWSKVFSIPTPAFNFSLNPEAAHPNLKVMSHDLVEWDPTANKMVQDNSRIKSAGTNRSASPVKGVSSSPRRSKPKDRFTGESYTILGDSYFPEEESYFEVAPHSDCKTYSVGISLKNLARFDQLGRTPTSWCLHVSNWIQNTFVAKHNNKLKNLESSCEIPSRIGVYFNRSTAILSFYDADTRNHIHTFKQVKCNGPIVPGFLMWFGSIKIFTGIQVPSWIVTRPSTSSNNKSDSSSNKSPVTPTPTSPEEKSL